MGWYHIIRLCFKVRVYLFFLYVVFRAFLFGFSANALVGLCRILSVDSDGPGNNNRDMEIMDRYIPREYLALKINYCRRQLEELPAVRMHEHIIDGSTKKKLTVGKHRYGWDTPDGKHYYRILLMRDEFERQLQLYEAMWDYSFKGPVPLLVPSKQGRTLLVGYNNPVVMDKVYFDSLKNDANTDYPKPNLYPFNGIQYRSAAEKSIAVFYTEMGIPFKYEPEVMLAGLRKPVYPDFVPYFREIDSCKFHEQFGIMDASDYIRETKIKFSNFTNAGLLQDLDFFFTYNAKDTPLDLRYLSSKINSVIFGSMVCRND